MAKLVTLVLKTIGSEVFQVLSHPCSNFEKSQQRHEESASSMEEKRETFEKIEMDKEQE